MKSSICLFLILLSLKVEAYRENYYDIGQGIQKSEKFAIFNGLTETSDANNLDEFLVEWKERDPDFFRYYLLAYRSRSLQEASFTAPRAILFSPEGDFMASFNGHKGQKGSENLEIIRFDHDEARFDFFELSWNSKGLNLSDPNPQKCLDCHQSLAREGIDPRPNWEPYFLWPGFYGSVDSAFLISRKQLSLRGEERLSDPKDSFLLDEIEQEKDNYEIFWEFIQPNHKRYSLLTPHDKEQARIDARIYGKQALKEIKNTFFTQRVAQLNWLRVARLMGEDKEFFDFFKEAIFASVACSPRALPDELKHWLYKNTSHYKKNQREGVEINSATFFNVLELGDKLKLLFEPFYFETDDWSMDFKTNGRFGFSSRFSTPGVLLREFREAFLYRYPEFAAFKKIHCSEKKEWDKILAKYKDMSLVEQAQKKRETFKHRIEVVKNTPLIKRCARCHETPSSPDTPMIPFNDEGELSKQLVQSGYPRGTLFEEIVYRIGDQPSSQEQMPPRGIATRELREDLVRYLQGLIK